MDGTDPVSGKNHVIAEDALTALFQTIETTFQVLKEDFELKKLLSFDTWLKQCSAYTIRVKAIRIIRHFNVHIGDLKAESSLDIPLFPAPDEVWVIRRWQLPVITEEQLKRLRSSKLSSGELVLWNNITTKEEAKETVKAALSDIRNILLEGEELL